MLLLTAAWHYDLDLTSADWTCAGPSKVRLDMCVHTAWAYLVHLIKHRVQETKTPETILRWLQSMRVNWHQSLALQSRYYKMVRKNLERDNPKIQTIVIHITQATLPKIWWEFIQNFLNDAANRSTKKMRRHNLHGRCMHDMSERLHICSSDNTSFQ